MSDEASTSGRSRDSIANTLIVAVGVSLVCSVLVSASAVVLRPLQLENADLYRKQIVLDVAGLYEPGDDIDAAFEQIEARLVNLETGDYVDGDANSFDAAAAANDPELGVSIEPAEDIANVGRRASIAPVYIVRDGRGIDQVILPVQGAGLWSTLYGYLSVEADGNTVRGLRFYEHAETAGLGDQIDRPDWRALWPGKELYDGNGDAVIEVVRGKAPDGPSLIHQVDGMSGATLTGNGVMYLVRYWVGPDAFGPYLNRIASEAD